MRVSLQVPAFKEPGLSDTLDAWAEQYVPSWADISYEAWVTPSGRGETWRQAEEHPVFEAAEAPQYKLRARNAAHDSAVERGYDAIMTVDADAPPLSDDTLKNLLTAAREPRVACVCANPVASKTPVGIYSNIGVYTKEVIGGIHGQCHVLSRGAWQHAGPFSDGVDHTDLKSVWKEEEYRFGRRLRQHGKVVYKFDAPVFNDTRRRECAWRDILPGEKDAYCEKPDGDETFHPRKPI